MKKVLKTVGFILSLFLVHPYHWEREIEKFKSQNQDPTR